MKGSGSWLDIRSNKRAPQGALLLYIQPAPLLLQKLPAKTLYNPPLLAWPFTATVSARTTCPPRIEHSDHPPTAIMPCASTTQPLRRRIFWKYIWLSAQRSQSSTLSIAVSLLQAIPAE
jgi:hypothetical protein